MKHSLAERLERYIKNQNGWVASGECERKAQEAGYTGSTASRRLRELEEAGKLDVKYIRGHAYYKAKERMSFEEYWLSIDVCKT